MSHCNYGSGIRNIDVNDLLRQINEINQTLLNVQDSLVTANAPESPVDASGVLVDWTELIDSGNNFDPVTGVYTVPRNGVYELDALVDYTVAGVTFAGTPEIQWQVNGNTVQSSTFSTDVAGTDLLAGGNVSARTTLQLQQGDQVTLYLDLNATAATFTLLGSTSLMIRRAF